MFESEFGTWAPGNLEKSRSAIESEEGGGAAGGVFGGWDSGFWSLAMIAGSRCCAVRTPNRAGAKSPVGISGNGNWYCPAIRGGRQDFYRFSGSVGGTVGTGAK